VHYAHHDGAAPSCTAWHAAAVGDGAGCRLTLLRQRCQCQLANLLVTTITPEQQALQSFITALKKRKACDNTIKLVPYCAQHNVVVN
jgi:hypothetical protein